MCERFSKYARDDSRVFRKFLVLSVIGFFIVFVGVIVLMIAAVLFNGSPDFGVFILIGPFLIVVGAGPEAPWMVLFAIVFAVFGIIMVVMLRGEMKKE